MSDSLADIDDTLADWHGSACPQRPAWHLDPAVWPHGDRVLNLCWASLKPGMLVQVYSASSLELLRVIEGPQFGPWRVRPIAERPKRLNARYRLRQKNRVKRRR